MRDTALKRTRWRARCTALPPRGSLDAPAWIRDAARVNAHRRARRWLPLLLPLLLPIAQLACSKDAQVRDDPAAPARSHVSAPSASSSAPPALPKVDVSKAGACDDGVWMDPADGLGSIGGMAHGAPGTVREELGGTVSSLEGKLTPDGVAKMLCSASLGFRACFEAAPGRASSKVSLVLEVGDDGLVTNATASPDPPAPPLQTCIIAVARKLVLTGADGAGGRARVGYALDFIGGPPPPAKSTVARMTEVSCVTAGRLPREVVSRIARANFPRARACYEAALKRDPKLEGLVTTRFVIDATGAVESSTPAGGTIADTTLTTCVAGILATLSFPEPEGGKVMVTYSLELNPPAP